MKTIELKINEDKTQEVVTPQVLVEGENRTTQIGLVGSPASWVGSAIRALITTPGGKLVDPVDATEPVELFNTMLDGPGMLKIEYISMRNDTEIDRTKSPALLYVSAARSIIGEIAPEPLPDLVAEMVQAKSECIAATAAAQNVASYAAKQYGLYWDGTTTSNGTRLGDAVGRVFNPTVGAAIGQNDFENLRPWRDCMMCNLNDAGQVVAYSGQPGFKIDGTNGQVMLEIPKFYYKSIASGDARERWVAPDPCPGYTIHPAFVVNGAVKNKIYVGAYMGSEDSGKLSSKSTVLPQYNKTITQFRALARMRGAGWGLCDLTSYNALQLLLLVMTGGYNAQSKVGKGISEIRYNASDVATIAESAANRIIVANAVAANFAVGDMIGVGTGLGGNQIAIYRQVTAIATYDASNTAITFDGLAVNIAIGNVLYGMPKKTGGADTLGQHTGRASGTDGKAEVSMMGLQGMWGNFWQMIDGANMDAGYYMWYNSDPSTCASDVFASPYKRIGAVLSQADGYIRRMGFDTAEPWSMLPSEVGGDSAGPIGDYYTRSATPGSQIALVGGNFFNGALDGPWYWNVSLSSGSAYWFIGSRLLYK